MSSTPRFEQALASLRNGLRSGRMAHAYLVVAPPQEEGERFAIEILRLLYCEAPDPCGVCRGCRSAADRSHPDTVWIEPRRKSRAIDIAQVRALQRAVNQTAYAGGWKACVISCADRLGDAAANALLKTLEEPPGASLFLLLTDSPETLLPTLVSRCQRILLAREEALPDGEWRRVLLEIVTAPCAGDVTGVTRRAFRMLTLLGALRDRAEQEDRTWDEAEGDEADAEAGAEPTRADRETREARIEARYRGYRHRLFRAWILWHRDLFLQAGGGDPALLAYPEAASASARLGAGLTCREALGNIQGIEQMYRLLERHVPEEAVLLAGVRRLSA